MDEKIIRSPIVSVLGHVDHGKTSILDALRGTVVAKKEAGGITQMIGASYLKKQVIEEILKEKKQNIKIPGLLFIDTPGHEAFTSLRERGGSIADIAILVIDINQGFQPQTIESIKILKEYKTPFLIVANKTDMIHGYKSYGSLKINESLKKQNQNVIELIENKIYNLVGKLSEYGIQSERFDRVTDFSKEVCIIPTSAKTKEGIEEILLYLIGLSQKFMGEKIKMDASGPGRGTILEVKEETGMGKTIDIILYDGMIKKNDNILFTTLNGIKQTKIKKILIPKVSSNNPKEKYDFVDFVNAASGVKLMASDLQGAISGASIVVIKNECEKEMHIQTMQEQIKKIIFEDEEKQGIVIKADSLGSIEAMLTILKNEKISIKSSGIGPISKIDVLKAKEDCNKEYSCILAFGVEILPNASDCATQNNVKIIKDNIIYSIVQNYKEWIKQEKEKEQKEMEKTIIWPAKIRVIPGCCFRISKPAIFGVEVLAGKICPRYCLINEAGEIVGEIKTIQKEKEIVKQANENDQVAISSMDILLEKKVKEGDILYSYLSKENMNKIKENFYDKLNEKELKIFTFIEKMNKPKI